MAILILLIAIIGITVLAVIWRKAYNRRNISFSEGVDAINLNTAKENAARSFRSTRSQAEKDISKSLDTIFNDKSLNDETENSKELNELSSKIDDLLK